MDTVSMLNKMSFYCQPILPLVYDESMSYYETLCKLVGQLNTTGETVNKLNEGLTGEISDRQAADAALDARIKEIEKVNKKIHFLKVGTLGHLLTPDVTREKLSQWVQDGDIISMLYAPDEQENSWAVATNYRCLGARGAETMQLSFYVPISIVNNAGKSGSDVAQEVVVISLPVGELTNQWVVRSITTTIPATNADGFVNLMASVGDDGAVTCDVEPGAIVEALRNYFRSTNQFAVAVNARLNYDGKQYHSSAATVKADASGAGNIRIAFENYYGGVRAENGVSQTVNTTIFLVGDVKTNVWTVETIDHKTFDFSRYEGFQFTRGAHNVITANDESTPNAVYAQYHSDTSGKIYQNLPVRLIDTVDNAEYWNGVFGIKDNKNMTFTFVTSNYVTASGKMLVRVIELSADVDTTTWKYAEKEFTLPLDVSNGVVTYTATNVGEGVYSAAKHKTEYQVDFNETTANIIAAIESGKKVILIVDLKDPDSNETYHIYFASGYTRADPFTNSAHYIFAGTLGGDQFTLELNSLLTHATLVTYGYILPEPNPGGTDNGKVPIINGSKWELKAPPAGSPDAVLYTAQTLTDEQKKQARDNIDAAIGDFQVTATIQNFPTCTLDKTFNQIQEAISKGKRVFARLNFSADNAFILELLSSTSTEIQFTAFDYNNGLNKAQAYKLVVSPNKSEIAFGAAPTLTSEDTLHQVEMAANPSFDMEIATKKYVDNHLGGSPITIKLGTGNAATSTATFAEIKAALEAGKAPVLDSEPGTTHWFALNWTLSGSDSLTIQYGTFNVEGGGAANFTLYSVDVNSTGITYVARQFTTE